MGWRAPFIHTLQVAFLSLLFLCKLSELIVSARFYLPRGELGKEKREEGTVRCLLNYSFFQGPPLQVYTHRKFQVCLPGPEFKSCQGSGRDEPGQSERAHSQNSRDLQLLVSWKVSLLIFSVDFCTVLFDYIYR